MDEQKRQLIEELAAKLNHASEAYYAGLPEEMTDFEWDAMFDRLKKLEEETGYVPEGSPTHTVSTYKESGQREEHEFAALSLAKTKKPEELVKWAEGRDIWLSWKLDGLTLVVTYDNGRLTRVVTRGNGQIGTNITHLAEAINGILPEIEEKGHLVIRGEAVISYEDFEQFRLEAEEDYANPRNLASGSMTLKDPEEVKKRKIRWIPFTLVYTDNDIVSWGDRMDFLAAQGFSPVQREKISVPDYDNITAVIGRWTEEVTSRRNPYPVDGLVICYDDTEYASTGSVTGHHAARAGYAFKWQDETAATKLDHIEWSCAVSTITPVAVFEPVELEGTTVKRASLCNISECERLGIGGKGTGLSVIKANKIIPKVVEVTSREGEFTYPAECPVCGAPTEVFISGVSGTKTLRCTNPGCTAKKLKKFTRFVSKPGTDIDGVSGSTLERFINEGWIRNFADIYRLMEHSEEIAGLDGFGEKSVRNLGNAIARSRTVPDSKMIYALGIPLVGPDVAKRLLSAFSFDELFEKGASVSDEEAFSTIDGIGPEKSAAFVRWCRDPENMQVLRLLKDQVTISETPKAAAGDLCKGLTFVVTGDVHHYRNRNELKAYIESQGGKVTGSVSKSTNYLINNDITSTSGKNQKARTLGIPVISEDEFIERFTAGFAG
ncbi:MAG: NAD-dependent DNA ligase LigA [Lachnospiraceae bacterium]|nr:NAD-dependent DNA ligase LigA [Lachnospiraceae bacterium]